MSKTDAKRRAAFTIDDAFEKLKDMPEEKWAVMMAMFLAMALNGPCVKALIMAGIEGCEDPESSAIERIASMGGVVGTAFEAGRLYERTRLAEPTEGPLQ